jgi:hypothetical protein
VRCDGTSPTTGRQCPNDAMLAAGASGAPPVYACPEHVGLHNDLSWRPLADEPPVLKLARAAAEALTVALETERDAAEEVETRSTKRTARLLLDSARQSAAVALGELAKLLPPRHVPEVAAMADGAARGYAVPGWALRIVAIASEGVTRG